MLLSACMGEVDVSVHSEILSTLIERSGVNALAKKVGIKEYFCVPIIVLHP